MKPQSDSFERRVDVPDLWVEQHCPDKPRSDKGKDGRHENERSVNLIAGRLAVQEQGKAEGDDIAEDEEGRNHERVVLEGAEERRRRYDELEIIQAVEGEVADAVPVAEAERECPDRGYDEDDPEEHEGREEEPAGGQLRPRPRPPLTPPAMPALQHPGG